MGLSPDKKLKVGGCFTDIIMFDVGNALRRLCDRPASNVDNVNNAGVAGVVAIIVDNKDDVISCNEHHEGTAVVVIGVDDDKGHFQ